VVNESGDNKEFQDIDDLQNRFKNLKSENQKLMKRVRLMILIYVCVNVEINDKQRNGGGKN